MPGNMFRSGSTAPIVRWCGGIPALLEGDFYQTSTAAPASCSPRATACPRHTSHAGHASHQTRLTSHVTHHTSRVTLHSQVTRHTSMDVTVTYPGYEPKISVVFSLFRLCCKRHTTGAGKQWCRCLHGMYICHLHMLHSCAHVTAAVGATAAAAGGGVGAALSQPTPSLVTDGDA